MKDQGAVFAIVLLAIAVFFVGGMRATSSPVADQYMVNDGKIFRFPATAPGRVEVLEKNAQGKYMWVVQ